MNEHRINLYSGIHKALRAQMSSALLHTARIDSNDADDVAGGLAEVRELLAVLQKHLEHERDFVHPMMHAAQAGSHQVTEDDHDHHVLAINNLHLLCNALEQGSGPGRQVALERLHLQLSVFVGENMVHMGMEETTNMSILWAHYSDAELNGIEQAILSRISPEEKQKTMRWMIPAMSPNERAAMFLGMRAGMPPPVFEGMLQMARGLLDARDWSKLEQVLAQPQSMAA